MPNMLAEVIANNFEPTKPKRSLSIHVCIALLTYCLIVGAEIQLHIVQVICILLEMCLDSSNELLVCKLQ